MVDRVKPLKFETPELGTQNNRRFPTEIDPAEDYVAAKGVSFEASEDRRINLDGSGDIQFTDATNPTGRTLRNITEQLNSHASRHSPTGADPLPTEAAVTVSTSTTNTEGNADSFARSNHTHKVEITSSTVKASASTSTTSTVAVLLSGMSVTPAAGTYKIMAHASATLSVNTTMFFSLFVGGAIVTDSEGARVRANNNVATQRMDWNYFDDIVVNGSQAIEIRWRTTTGTATAFDRQLSILKVS
jgi:hypothetical protein